jgi:hypothetical protein
MPLDTLDPMKSIALRNTHEQETPHLDRVPTEGREDDRIPSVSDEWEHTGALRTYLHPFARG